VRKTYPPVKDKNSADIFKLILQHLPHGGNIFALDCLLIGQFGEAWDLAGGKAMGVELELVGSVTKVLDSNVLLIPEQVGLALVFGVWKEVGENLEGSLLFVERTPLEKADGRLKIVGHGERNPG